MRDIVEALKNPTRLWSRRDALSRGRGVSAEPGIYAWYFQELPPDVPADVHRHQGHYLLYVGVSPARAGSLNNLRKRIRAHFSGNASGSTLRLTLGCLLAQHLALDLCPTPTGRLTFGKGGEAKLSSWLEQNAFVTWVPHEKPWTIERQIIAEIKPVLNLQHNEANPSFHACLSKKRRDALAMARANKQSP